ncbi:MAG: glucosyltransferase domain-containing protein [Akkermansia sp.]|nr:glucosyltransferase domain-containing protein [Akkermansia sp.]
MQVAPPQMPWYQRLLKEEGPWFVLYFCIFLLVYGYSVLRLGMYGDDLYDFNGEETGLYAAAGRWGIVLWRGIFGLGACVWAAGIASGLLLSTVIVCQCKLLKLQGPLQRLVYGGFYLGCIQFNHMLQFSFLCDALAASFLAVTGAVWMVQQRGYKTLLGGIGLLSLAFGTYQATCFYFTALFLVMELRRLQLGENAERCARIGRFILTGLGAATVWLLVKYATVHLPFVTQEQLSYAQGYQSSLSCWPQFIAGNAEQKLAIIRNIFMIGYWGQWVCLSALVALVLLAKRFKQRFGAKVCTAAVAAMLLLCIVPYALGFVLLRQQTPWTFIAEPVMLAGFWGLFVAEPLRVSPRLQQALLLFLAFVLVKGMYANAEWARNEARYFDISMAEMRELRSTANAAALQAGIETPKVILLGEPMRRPNVSEKASDHTLVWAYFLQFYLRYLKLNHMHIGNSADYAKMGTEFNTMPTWPATGSVRTLGNEVFIKIGPR